MQTNPPQLTQMGLLVNGMLEQALVAYAENDVHLANMDHNGAGGKPIIMG